MRPAAAVADTLKGRRRLRRLAPLAAVIIAVAAGSTAYAANSGGGPSYVTGRVTRGDVQQTLDLTGAVQQVNSVSAAFPVSGTVTSVSVAVGEQVSAGQEIARIDAAPLQSALLEAQATLAQAQATLQSDESGTSSSGSTATTSASVTGAMATTTLIAFTPGAGSGTGGNDLTALEKAVTADQAQAASSQAAVNTALLAAITACGTSSSPSPSPSGSPTPTPSGSAVPTPSASAHTTAYTTSATSCTDALAAVQRAEAAEAAATKQLGDAVSKLASAAAASQSTGRSSGGSATGANNSNAGSSAGSSSGLSSGNLRSGSSFASGQGSSGTGNSASRIATDQANVTTAQIAVTDAQRNLDAAILRSPTAGTVASVGLTNGGTASTSSAITIVSKGDAQVTIDVPLASMPSVKVGQTAYVTPNGATTAAKGAVASIGLLPASGSTSTASYPVAVLVPDSNLMQLPTGSSAQVSLLMSTARDAVTVPNSAVTRLGTGANSAFVTVMSDGKATRTRVTTGAVGTLVTQVVSGLTVGQLVVLADRSASLPANSSTSTRVFAPGGGGGFAGFGGASGFGGTGRTAGR
jgi:multidrug efflux pump subunit AcrA (membrane-fusion protein)